MGRGLSHNVQKHRMIGNDPTCNRKHLCEAVSLKWEEFLEHSDLLFSTIMFACLVRQYGQAGLYNNCGESVVGENGCLIAETTNTRHSPGWASADESSC
ncbi:hypothetical protein PoB_007661300 [Plakobranchus ocellatus]|uniref:CN hydrolase domain-containing protein n=1 Tax=Plakobranchus ocellatus TaxID=259542 RepID=A0AAV4E189_9GAST|nr:hypothetical protein PoB_007661300 [Plakobranchus ocellatus]